MSKQETLFYNGDNYQEWEFATRHHLNAKKLGSTLKTEKPVASKAEELKEWLAIDEQAMGKIVERVLPKFYEHLREASTAQEMITTVKNITASDEANLLFRTQTMFRGLKMKEGGDVVNHIAKLEEYRRILGKLVSEPDMINQVMRSLPKSWENVLPAIRAQTSLMTNYRDFKGKTISEYEMRADSNETEPSRGVARQAKQSTTRFKGECNNCRKPGHKKTHCWAKGGDKEGQGPRQRERKNDEKKANQVNQSRSYVLTAAKSKAGDGDWILDSGASNHMTGDKGIIKDLKNKDDLGKVMVASGDHMKGASVSFDKRGASVSVNKKIILHANDIREGLYTLQENKAGLTTMIIRETTMREAHCFMEHLNAKDLGKLEEQANGISIKDEELGDCSVCMESKTTRSVGKEKSARVEKPGEELNVDLTFVNRTPILMVSDTGSGCTFAKILGRKSDACQGILDIIKLIETQYNHKLKTIVSDGGGEFINSKFTKWTLLADSKMDKEKYWIYAFEMAVYIRNRCPTRATTGNKTPIEALTGKKPNLKYMRRFGEKCVAYVNGHKRRKLDTKSVKCRVLGIKEKGYLLVETDKLLSDSEGEEEEPQRGRSRQQRQQTPEPEERNSEEEEARSPSPICILQRLSQLPPNEQSSRSKTAVPDQTQHVLEPRDKVAARDINSAVDQSNIIDGRRRQATYAFSTTTEDPKSIGEALQRDDAPKWKDAILYELNSLVENGTWEVIDLKKEPTENIADTKWAHKWKQDAAGVFEKYELQLVVRGFTQVEGVDYDETFVPLVRSTTIKALISVALAKEYRITQMDVVTAYLNSKMDYNVVIRIPDGYELLDPQIDRKRHALRLLKCLYDLKGGRASFQQSSYLESIGQRYQLENTKYRTPLEAGIRLPEEAVESTMGQYRSLLGAVMYASVSTRPDVAYATAYLGRFASKATEAHWTALRRLTGYLVNTSKLELRYTAGKANLIEVWVNASRLSEGAYGVSSHAMFVGGNLVSWWSRKQKTVALLSMEAEVNALVDVVKEVMWLRELLTDLGVSGIKTVIHEDNQAAIASSRNAIVNDRTRHMLGKTTFICEAATSS
ncbi:DNA-directed DNA polymerase [Chytriomyces confervae]|uniref:DNA-directed DNA polymerase n=1 Tax=Chytriomyces confervae TaxID=246404 RepID=A0A507EBZ1_9FUNG|nr:DNA-directed DNA polymerase [Chytriomyces confervae]